jgi:hypothetical protein
MGSQLDLLDGADQTMPIPFIGRRFSLAEFKDYLDDVQLSSAANAFWPRHVTLHHTAIPSLAMRPSGFSDQHLRNLRDYYQDKLKWSGAPHLFIDDQAKGIIVFQRLDRRGVHAVAFNRSSWGIEMLGNFDLEDPGTGRGKEVYDLAIQAAALMTKRLGARPDSLRFHREDPNTNKSCPGWKVDKAKAIRDLARAMALGVPDDLGETEEAAEWTVRLPGGAELAESRVQGGRPIAEIRPFFAAISREGAFALSRDKTVLVWTEPGGLPKAIRVAQIDEAGSSWAYVRELAEAAGLTVSVSGRTVSLG